MLNSRQIKLMSTILNLALGVILSLVILTILHAGLTPVNIFINTLISFVVGCAVGDYIPALELGISLAAKFGFKPDSIMGYVISTIVLAFFMATFISFFSMMIGMGLDIFMGVWIHLYPIILITAIIVLLILRGIVTKVALSCFND